MKKMKKILCALLVVMLCLTSAPMSGLVGLELPQWSFKTSALAPMGKGGDYVYWNFDSSTGELVISGRGEMHLTGSIGETPFGDEVRCVIIKDGVTSISSYAFSWCKNLESIEIADSVKEIHSYAFKNCQKLERVNMGNGITSIGYGAFEYCVSLTELVLSDSVTFIDDWAFADCYNLSKIVIPQGVKYIGLNAFDSTAYYDENAVWYDNATYIGDYLIEVDSDVSGLFKIKDGTTIIAASVFADRDELTSVIIPDSVKHIGYNAFNGCDSLIRVSMGSGVISIGDRSFYECENLESIVLGNNVVDIGSSSFSRCVKLKNINIPSSTKRIGLGAFWECSSLQKISIPGSIEHIETCAFRDCTNLNDISIADEFMKIEDRVFLNTGYYNNSSNWDNDVLYIGNHLIRANTSIAGKYRIREDTLTIAERAFLDCVELTEVVIPDSVIHIGGAVFEYCTKLEKVNIPYGITELNSTFIDCFKLADIDIPDTVRIIGDFTFYNCWVLNNVVIPEGVTTIGDGAFTSCTKLSNIIVPDSVICIKDAAFNGCTSLKNFTISENVEIIGKGAFWYCSKLTSIVVDENNENYSSEDGVLFNKDKTVLISYPAGGNSTYSVPNSVSKIDDYAFFGCDNITDISVESSVKQIGYNSFANCSNLANIEISDGVESIGEDAFWFCTKLLKITLPNSVKRIDYRAFGYCQNLAEVNIGNGVTFIDVCAFEACNNLTDVYYHGTKAQWDEISIGEGNDPLLNATVHFLGEEECDHNPVEQTIPATCTVNGMKFYICSECGDTIGETEIIPASHTPGEWETVLEPTYEAEGKKVKKCTVCGEILEEEIIPKLELTIVEDEKTGVGIEYPKDKYDGDVDIKVEESFDGTAFNILDAKTGAVQQKIYDIKMFVGGEETQPNGKITVRIPLPADYNPKFSFVYYVNTEKGTVEKMDAKFEDGYMVFETDHFSYYAIIAEPDVDNCSCNCHKGGFMGFIWNIINFFQKLFKINGTCDCGVAHY